MASSNTSPTSFETQVAEFIRARGGNASETNYQYPYPSHVNAASFVSIKLLSKTNYSLWQEQMMCLVESHDMLSFINGTLKNPKEHATSNKQCDNTMEAKCREWKRSDTLVKGWIFGSLSENVMHTVVGLYTANDVWEKLKTTYSTPPAPTTTTASCSNTIKKDEAEYLPLYRAITRNDWEKAHEIFNQDKDALTAKLDNLGSRALHIAIEKAESMQFLENLLKEINPESLPTLVTIYSGNPLHHAAAIDNTMAAKMLVKKNPYLLFSLDGNSSLPIHTASLNSHRRTFLYLLDACKNHIRLSQQDGYHSPFEGINGARLLSTAIESGFLEASNELIKDYPDMARSKCIKDNAHWVPLWSISSMWDLYHNVPIEKNLMHDTNKIQDVENQETYKAKFLSKSMETCFYVIERIYVKIWKAALLKVPHIKHLQEEKVKHQEALLVLKSICKEVAKIDTLSDICEHYQDSLSIAAHNDTPEVIEQIIQYFPGSTLVIINGCTLFQVAIKERCEKLYNFLLCHMSYDQYRYQQGCDKVKNSTLHLAGQLAPTHKLNRVSGAALQMQRELQWFEEVGNFVKPKYKYQKNISQETPIMVFRREHKQLRNEGEEWMKKTADSYTIVAALIITIVFAAAITVPGGNDDVTGKAIYETKPSFIVFAISDAISLFSSTTSLLLFLSILTTRYREEDFLYRLPKRLILGLTMLFLSVTSMMVAFSATLYLMFGQEKAWIMIPIATLTCLPIASFVTLQLPLLVDLISSTYGYGIFVKQSDCKMKQS
uniref:PGG domain-containing protein n=1 Tax=Lactuca sativa TaxID=4236 RepID=A0A9R1X6Y5_LACSA|nr:hypothetical protein LSAT_V11C600330570 [Lactuca sativa]